MMNPAIIAIIGVFSSIILTVYLFFKTRNQERMELIRSGVSMDILHRNRANARFQTLKWGFISLFVGIGVFVGALLEESRIFDEALAVIFSILIIGGLGMIIFYYFSGRLTEDN